MNGATLGRELLVAATQQNVNDGREGRKPVAGVGTGLVEYRMVRKTAAGVSAAAGRVLDLGRVQAIPKIDGRRGRQIEVFSAGSNLPGVPAFFCCRGARLLCQPAFSFFLIAMVGSSPPQFASSRYCGILNQAGEPYNMNIAEES